MDHAITLASAARLAGFEVLRDATFSTLGFLIDDLPGMLLFVESRRFLAPALRKASAAALIVTPELASLSDSAPGLAVSAAPKRAFFQLQNALVASGTFYGWGSPSEIHPSAVIHERAWVAPTGVRIAARVSIAPNAAVHAGASLAEGVEVRAGAVLGGAGFQTYRGDDGLVELAHGGGIEVGEAAIIFENAVIARGVFRQNTRIGTQSRIGACAFVSHNAVVGARTHIGHGAVINGNVSIGEESWIGPGATVSNNLSIGASARVSLGSVVVRDVAANEHVTGNFALPHREFLRRMGRAER